MSCRCRVTQERTDDIHKVESQVLQLRGQHNQVVLQTVRADLEVDCCHGVLVCHSNQSRMFYKSLHANWIITQKTNNIDHGLPAAAAAWRNLNWMSASTIKYPYGIFFSKKPATKSTPVGDWGSRTAPRSFPRSSLLSMVMPGCILLRLLSSAAAFLCGCFLLLLISSAEAFFCADACLRSFAASAGAGAGAALSWASGPITPPQRRVPPLPAGQTRRSSTGSHIR